MTRRLHGRLFTPPSPDSFCVLVDGAPHTVELAPDADVQPRDLHPGDLVSVRLDAAGRALRVTRAAEPLRDPFAPGAETRRLSLDGAARRLRDRMRIADAVRAWLRSEDFLEVDTPAVVPNPGSDLHLAAYAVHGPSTPAGWLITSPEYAMKRLLAGGVARCAQFARCWRADERGDRHQPEFTMLEWYRAWEGLDAVLADTEAIVRAAVGAVGDPEAIVRDGHQVSLARPFQRVTVREAFARYAPRVGDPIELAERDEATYYAVFSTEVEPNLGREHATFLTGFPAVQASLARVDARDPRCASAPSSTSPGSSCATPSTSSPTPRAARPLRGRRPPSAATRACRCYPLDEEFLAALGGGDRALRGQRAGLRPPGHAGHAEPPPRRRDGLPALTAAPAQRQSSTRSDWRLSRWAMMSRLLTAEHSAKLGCAERYISTRLP
jgi:lysyl-tRNA synthetase class 2